MKPKTQTSQMLAEIIKTARTEAGLTQKELAGKIGSEQPTIARAEKGNVHRLDWVERVVRACGFQLKFHHVSLNRGNRSVCLFFGGANET